MNPEKIKLEEFTNWKSLKEKEQETEINIGEVYFDQGLENILDKEEFATEMQKINKEIEEYLGENENLSTYDFRIYSNRGEYEDYIRTNFSEKPEENYIDNDMIFYYDEKNNKNVIAKFMKVKSDPNDPSVQEYLEKTNITFDELEPQIKENYKNNTYPTMAHELTHSHSFFEGVDYKESGNKWAQEMVCVFIDQKKWEKCVPSYKKMIEAKAREQAQNKDLYNEIVRDFEEGDFQIEDWERLFYPFLENKYGKEKLIQFFSTLFKDKADFEQCFEVIFKEELKDTMSLFQKEIMKEKN